MGRAEDRHVAAKKARMSRMMHAKQKALDHYNADKGLLDPRLPAEDLARNKRFLANIRQEIADLAREVRGLS